MIQKHQILMTLTGTTSVVESYLQNVNGYEVNNIQNIGGDIVNFSNVRGFLNDNNNVIISNDFFVYLTQSLTGVEFSEIYNSDQKLSSVFNNYYNSRVINNQAPSTIVIDEGLSGTTGMTVIDSTIFKLNGVAPAKGLNNIPLSINDSTRELKVFSALTTFTYEPSYYVPIFISRNYSQIDREKLYFENIIEQLNAFVPDIEDENIEGNDYTNDYTNDYGGY